MTSRRQKNIPSIQKDTRKLPPSGRETLRRKTITMYKRSCSVAMISAKLGTRKATIYRWIKLYKTHGFKMYKEGKRGRPLLNYYVPERQFRKNPEIICRRQRPLLPDDLPLFLYKEFLSTHAKWSNSTKYDYICNIRACLRYQGIEPDDEATLTDKNFLRNQFKPFYPVPWKKYYHFLQGKTMRQYGRQVRQKWSPRIRE